MRHLTGSWQSYSERIIESLNSGNELVVMLT